MKKRHIKKLLKKVVEDKYVTPRQSQWLLKRYISHYRMFYCSSPGYNMVIKLK